MSQYHGQHMAEPNSYKRHSSIHRCEATTNNEPLEFRTALYRRRAQSYIECDEDGVRTDSNTKNMVLPRQSRVARHSERVRK